MPTKRGKLHAHVHPWGGYATNFVLFLVDDLEKRGGGTIEIIQIK